MDEAYSRKGDKSINGQHPRQGQNRTEPEDNRKIQGHIVPGPILGRQEVKIVNINHDSGEKALERSESLNGYSFLIAQVRKNLLGGMSRDEAIAAAIDLCIRQGVIANYLNENYGRVIKMIGYEYDAEREKREIAEENMEKGMGIGMELIKKVQQGEMSIDEAFRAMEKLRSMEFQPSF